MVSRYGILGALQLHIHAVALLQAADDDLHVLLPAAGEQEFLGLRVAIEAQRLVFFQNLVRSRCPCDLRRCASWRKSRKRWKAPAIFTGGYAISDALSASVSPVSVSFSLATPPISPACSSVTGVDAFAQQRADVRQPLRGAGARVDQVGVVLQTCRTSP